MCTSLDCYAVKNMQKLDQICPCFVYAHYQNFSSTKSLTTYIYETLFVRQVIITHLEKYVFNYSMQQNILQNTNSQKDVITD